MKNADDEAFIPESIIQDQEKSRLMREIIDGLSDMQRLCIIGYYYNEQKQEEIAEEFLTLKRESHSGRRSSV